MPLIEHITVLNLIWLFSFSLLQLVAAFINRYALVVTIILVTSLSFILYSSNILILFLLLQLIIFSILFFISTRNMETDSQLKLDLKKQNIGFGLSLFQNLPIHLINNEGKIVQNNENNFEGNKCGLSKIDSTNLLMNSIGESNEAEDYYQYYNEADPSFVITVAIEDVLLNIGIRENESAGYFVVYLEKNNVLECNYCPSLDTKYKFGNIYNTFESAINSVRNQIDAKTKSEISNFKTDLKVFDWSNKTDNLIYVDLGHCPKCPPYIKYEINSSSHYLEDYRSFVFELFPFMNSIMVNAPH